MSDRTLRWVLRATLAAPFLVALIVLAGHHWSPVLDLAMTEFRVRDVGGAHTPLIGLPGRIGHFPDQGSHPGPLSFHLLTPTYRLLGSTAYGLLAGTAVVNVAATWTALWAAARQGGRRLAVGVAAMLAVALAWFGASILTQPWNPYLPLASFAVVLLAGWAVLDGDHRMLVAQVAAGTLCAQTHVPYLSLAVALIALSFGVIGWRWWRGRAVPRQERTSVLVAVGVAAVLWLPVFVDQWRHDPGNITMLRRHFLDPPEAPQGLAVGVKTVLRHFDVVHLATAMIGKPSYVLDALGDLEGGSWVVGLLVVLVWMGAASVAWRLADRRPFRLHLIAGVATVVAVVSTARIFGKVWYYLTLWSWLIGLVAVAATLWTAVVVAEQRWRRLPVTAVAGAVLAVASLAFVVDAARVDPPEDHLGSVLTELVGPTADALAAGQGAATGSDGVYVVRWADAYYFGSQGYGLISELERRGFDARATPTFRVPVTPQRTIDPALATAEVVLATGVNVAKWRAVEGAVEVAFVEPRSERELVEFEALRAQVVDGLHAEGLDDLVDLVDTNLFGLSIDPALPADLEPAVARMLILGEESAVFIAPPGSFDAAG